MVTYTQLLLELQRADERISEAAKRCAAATRNSVVGSDYIDSSQDAITRSRVLLERVRIRPRPPGKRDGAA